MHFDQYSRLAIHLNIFRFLDKISKTNSKFQKSFPFVCGIETNPLIYNINDLKQSPAIRMKIVVQTDGHNRFQNVLPNLLNDIWHPHQGGRLFSDEENNIPPY